MRPLRHLRRFFTTAPPRSERRALEAASGGWRVDPAATSSRQNADILAGGRTVRSRARYEYQNNPAAHRAAEALTGAAVGNGFTARSCHSDPDQRDRLGKAFEDWAASCGTDGASLASTTALVSQTIIRDGEALAILEVDEARMLTLRLVDIDQLDSSLHRDLGGGARIVAGVEFDQRDRRIAYHIHNRPLDMPFATIAPPVRIDARNVLHVFRRDFVGQVRGLSWFAPVLRTMQDLSATLDAHLMKMKTEALVVGFIKDQTGDGASPLDGEREGDTLTASLEPGTMICLPPGKDVTSMTPTGTAAGAIDIIKLHQRNVAAGVGVTYEQITGDLSGVNYSSIRAGLIEFRRRVRSFQTHILTDQFLRPIWRRWIELEALAGRIDSASYAAGPREFLSVKFIPPGFEWVDPEKEIRADAEAVSQGFKSRREVVAGRGVDLDQLDEEIAEDTRSNPTAGAEPDKETTA